MPLPPTLRGAAIVQAAEAVVVLAATILAGVDAASGQSYHVSSGIALTLIGALAAAGLAWIARGLAQARRWSKPPAPGRKPPASGGKPPASARKPPAPAAGRKRAR